MWCSIFILHIINVLFAFVPLNSAGVSLGGLCLQFRFKRLYIKDFRSVCVCARACMLGGGGVEKERGCMVRSRIMYEIFSFYNSLGTHIDCNVAVYQI